MLTTPSKSVGYAVSILKAPSSCVNVIEAFMGIAFRFDCCVEITM